MARARVLRVLAPALLAALLPALAPAGEHDPGFPFHPRGRIGVELLPMGEQLRGYFRVEGSAGVLVSSVEAESAGAEAGLRAGDVITRANGDEIARPADLARKAGTVPEGETLELELVRDGKKSTVSVKPRGRPWERDLGMGPRAFHRPWRDDALEEIRERMRELERRIESLESAPDQDRT